MAQEAEKGQAAAEESERGRLWHRIVPRRDSRVVERPVNLRAHAAILRISRAVKNCRRVEPPGPVVDRARGLNAKGTTAGLHARDRQGLYKRSQWRRKFLCEDATKHQRQRVVQDHSLCCNQADIVQ